MKMIRQPVYDTQDRPFLIIWETTQACDLACRHCRAEASPHHDPLELNFEESCRLIDQIESFGTPRPLFVMTGGDPFKRADIFDLARYGSERGLPVALSPSGTPLLNEANLLRIKEAGAHVISLSLDGSTAALHDDFRRVPGSFEWTVNGWKKALSLGLKIQLNTTVTRYNLFDLPAIFALVRDLGVMTWSVFFLVPTGRALPADQISADDCEAVMHFLYDCSKYVGCKTTEGHHYKRVVLQRTVLEARGIDPRDALGLNDTYARLKAGLDAVTRGTPPPAERMRRTPMHINSAQGFVFISLRGDVYPSGYLPLRAGNVREQTLPEIYRSSPLFQSLRNLDELRGRCGQCEFRRVCGGSRSRAYGTSGDVLAEEPLCAYQPGSFAYMEDVQALLSRN